MHLVLVSSLLPVEQPESGFDIANRTLLEGLRGSGSRISLLGYKTPGAALAQADGVGLLGEIEVSNARVSAALKLKWLLAALAGGTTVSSAKMLASGRPNLERALKALEPFDGLILNSVQLPAAYLPVFMRYPSIFVAHNVESLSAAQNAQFASTWPERMLFRREARLVGRLERQLCLGSRFVWTLAEEDRRPLEVDDDTRSATLPMVTRVDPPTRTESMRALRFDIGMVGTWSWQPNRIGLDWFLEKVVPLLPGSLTIAIAGHLPDPPAPSHPGLRFLGRVPDAQSVLGSCAVISLPVMAGTGVLLKTIETFEMGLPAVATPGALRGIATVPENCLVASEPDRFAEALQRLVTAVRDGSVPPIDGRPFHAGQLRGLRKAINLGLARLGEVHP